MANRRFYWMKLPSDYFGQLIQKKMRKQPDGAEMQLIYLKMLLYCIDKDADIIFQGVYDSVEDEIAEEIGEEAEAVKKTLSFLEANKKLERTEHGFILPEALERVGSEGTSAERMRNMRQRKASQSDGEVSQCDTDVTGCDAGGAQCNVDIDKDIDIDQEKDKDKSKIKSIYCVELSETPQRQQPPKTDKKPETIEVEPVPSGYKIILLDKSFYEIPLEKLNFWKESYPAVDVEQEIRNMEAWADANPIKRKTRNGVVRFITNWLKREQDKGGSYQRGNSRQNASYDLESYLQQRINGGNANDNTGTGFTDYSAF